MTEKKQDVAFLTEEFEMSPRRAAALVTDDPQQAEALAVEQLREERERDPYGDAPVPTSPEDGEVSANGGLQKTVIKTENKASRTGP
jgi:hypothetical protein